jgi:hypothetical protein
VIYVTVIIGSLNHAFFILYLLTIAMVFSLFNRDSNQQISFLSNVWKVVNGKVLLVAIFIVSLVNFPWIRRFGQNSPTGYDPFQYTRSEGGFASVWIDLHFQFVPFPSELALIAAAVVIVLSIGLLIFYFRTKKDFLDVYWSSGFIVALLIIPLLLSVAAIVGGYQIIPRQWLASLALMPVAFVWLSASVYLMAVSRKRWIGYGFFAILLCSVLAMSAYRSQAQVNGLMGYQSIKTQYVLKWAGITEKQARDLKSEIGWEVWNVNAYLDRRVWSLD